jgi:prophage regulatory protein
MPTSPGARDALTEHAVFSALPSAGITRPAPAIPTRMLRLSQVIERTGLGKTSIYALQKSSNFPHSVPLTANSVRWVEAEIEAWLTTQAATRVPRPPR